MFNNIKLFWHLFYYLIYALLEFENEHLSTFSSYFFTPNHSFSMPISSQEISPWVALFSMLFIKLSPPPPPKV